MLPAPRAPLLQCGSAPALPSGTSLKPWGMDLELPHHFWVLRVFCSRSMFVQRAGERVVSLSNPTPHPSCPLSERGFVRFHTHLPSTVYAEVHKSRTIQVEVEAYPQPSIVWLKNNKTLTMESSSEFTITSRNLSETR